MIETRDGYKCGTISKQRYIDSMYKFHCNLFEYAGILSDTDIKKIEIEDDKVIMTSRISNIKILCEKPDKRIAPVEILNFNYYEKMYSDMIFRLMEQKFNVFDIGANIGWYTLNIAKRFDKANIFAFEPVVPTFHQLEKNVEINKFNNIKIYNFGFSNQEAELFFYFEPEMSVGASAANISNKFDYIIIDGEAVQVGETMSVAQGVFTFSFGTFKIEIRNLGDIGIVTGVNEDFLATPLIYSLDQNFPNPFNPETRIYFQVPTNHDVQLVIYNMMGQQIRTLVDEAYSAGRHVVNWDGRNNDGIRVPSGMYVYRIKAGEFIDFKKMMLVK